MSSTEITDLTGHLGPGASPTAKLQKLAELARQAFEQKRTKDCLDLTRAILLIDPENAAAQAMRSSIQSEMQRDLESARAFLRQAKTKEIDSEAPVEKDEALEEIIAAVAAPPAPRSKARWLILASVVILLTAAGVAWPRLRTRPNVVTAPPPVVEQPAATAAAAPPVAVEPTPTPVAVEPPAPVVEPPKPLAPTPPPAKPADTRAAAVPGTLAVSSPTSVDIYKDDMYLGSAPVSLTLPAGTHTLEYRHANLRKRVTHVVNGNETTRAMITFDVTVQLNSKPWAEVFLEGTERKALGQTPLSGVRVPIGGVLTFENPRFDAKRYRVTGNETGIQIVFP